MAFLCFWLCVTLLVLRLASAAIAAENYQRSEFPPGFVFGASTSAYQVEGAANEDGRTPSIWDTFVHAGYSGGATGDVACDEYHKYKEDVQLMVETGLDAYRFSISWSRLIPNGKGPVNPKGLQYYNNLINELLRKGIQPHVTLHNFDLPQALEDEYGGWLSKRVVEDFTAYADVCFREFGDRVLYWTTVNEPNVFALGGYDQGITPPGRCSFPFGLNKCSRGNSSTEPYLAAHNILLAHASVKHLYKKKYQDKQHGFIGVTLYASGIFAVTNLTIDVIAAQRAYDFYIGWIMNPLLFGDYPAIMKKHVGSRLPNFTLDESTMVKGSFDFVGVIHYSTASVEDNSDSLKHNIRDYTGDSAVAMTTYNLSGSEEFPVAPEGLQSMLEHFKQFYGNPPIYIYENGQRARRDSGLEDMSRVVYLNAYIGATLNSIRNGSNTRGYFVWSFLDVFELLGGYESGYGLYYVDLDDPDLTRYPKFSAHWYSSFLKGKNMSSNGIIERATSSMTNSRAHASQ